MRSSARWGAIGGSVALILLATLSPAAVDATGVVAQWRFWVGGTPVTDACSNVLLFVPLGAAVAGVTGRVSVGVMAGVVLSLLVEVLQSQGVPSGRYATIADLLANGVGALIGALLAAHRGTLWQPSVAVARGLALAWTVGASVLLIGTGWMLSSTVPGLPAGDDARVVVAATVSPSALMNAPGYPWFAGLVEEVSVGGVPVRHVGTGPVRAAVEWGADSDANVKADAKATQSNELRLTVRGRNPLGGTYPLLFLHQPGERAYMAMIAQRDRDLVVRSARQGDAAGVRMPMAVIPGAFDGLVDAHGIETGAPSDPRLQVHATISSGALVLAMTSAFVEPARAESVRLLMTPALGWMLVLAADVDGVWTTRLATVCWLLLLVAPACFWGWRSGEGRARVTLLVTLALCVVAALASMAFDVALFPWWQWAAMLLSALSGILLSRFTAHAANGEG